MKKSMIKRSLAILSCCVLSLGNLVMQVNAEEQNVNNSIILVVTATDEDSVLLDNGSKLYQAEFQRYSGNDQLLKYGDVIEMNYVSIEPIIPGQFTFDDNSFVKYLGTVADYYKDNIKELTVTNKSSDNHLELTDDKGNIYVWSSYAGTIDMCGFTSAIAPQSINEGDVLSCAVEERNYYKGKTMDNRMEVILPIGIVSKAKKETEEIKVLTEKITAEATLKGDVDVNGSVDLADLTTLAKYNLSNSSYPLENETAYANADMNGDGVVDGLDTSALIENQLGK